MPIVAVGSLGGTITMTAQSPGVGVTPTAGADDLVAAVPGLSRVAEVYGHTLQRVPGASLAFGDLLDALTWARRAVDSGAAGVVLVQGTDTLEESAYLLDLFWDRPEPLVLTGAMRNPAQASADGPGNVLAAVTAAAAPAVRDMGVLAVMNDEIHAASRVRKTHSTAVHAFQSPGTGAIGRVVEGEVVTTAPAPRQHALPTPTVAETVRIALLESSLDDRGDLIGLAASAGYDGIVLGGFGVGHVSAAAAEAVSEAARVLPVIVASRTGAGSTLSRTYGFTGSESDLVRRGAILAGWLDPRKSRLLLWALLTLGRNTDEVRRQFARRGHGRSSPPVVC